MKSHLNVCSLLDAQTLTQFFWLTMIVEQPVGWFLLRGWCFNACGRISSRCSRKS